MNDQSRDRGQEPPVEQSEWMARLRVGRLSPPAYSQQVRVALGATTILMAVLIWLLFRTGGPSYITQPIMRGPFAVIVSATGTLAPREQVDVIAEISGRIDSITVDFNDHVRKGQVLAHINTDQLKVQLAQARAALDQSRATLSQNEDTIRRDRALVKSGAVSPQQLVAAEGDYDRARAGVALASAQAKQDETILSKATIYAPIGGVVLDRKVSAGQTVVVAPQAPVLFTLASDLSQMELNVEIHEADVGEVHPGNAASFTVNAFPARQFSATLISVHNAPKVVHGVVTYEGVLLVQNREGVLRPGMTATAAIEAARVGDALLVPDRALRYGPPAPARNTAPPLPRAQNGVRWGRVWSLAGERPIPHDVRLGPSDGKQTAISGGDLQSGDAVIVETKRR